MAFSSTACVSASLAPMALQLRASANAIAMFKHTHLAPSFIRQGIVCALRGGCLTQKAARHAPMLCWIDLGDLGAMSTLADSS